MQDLKRILMMLGNILVTEHGYTPCTCPAGENEPNTKAIIDFTKWMNVHPEAQQVLKSLGFDWRM